jgi:hypothetical protein
MTEAVYGVYEVSMSSTLSSPLIVVVVDAPPVPSLPSMWALSMQPSSMWDMGCLGFTFLPFPRRSNFYILVQCMQDLRREQTYLGTAISTPC